MRKVIETGYAAELDLSVITEWTMTDDGDPIGMEIISFYAGEPNEKDTAYYSQPEHRHTKCMMEDI